MRTITTWTSPQSSNKNDFDVVRRLKRKVSDTIPVPVIIVKLAVNPSQCRTAVGRALAESVTHCSGKLEIIFNDKTNCDQSINGHAPGSLEHAELCKIWGVTPTPIRKIWSRWPNFAKAGYNDESPEAYFDRIACKMVGPEWVNESVTIRRIK